MGENLEHKEKENSYINLPTAYWGSISYFQDLYNYPWKINENENFQKRSIRNRCHILGPNGKQMLSIPLTKGKNSQCPIKAVKIYHEENWVKDHLACLQTAYGKSPYFIYYFDEIKAIYNNQESLFELNANILKWIFHRFPFFLEEEHKLAFQNKSTQEVGFNHLLPDSNAVFYHQVFDYKFDFVSNLSILDAIFNLGPELRTIF